MADFIEMNAMYQRLGFTAAASALFSEAQGMDEIYELSLLTDTEVDARVNLCGHQAERSLTRPVGQEGRSPHQVVVLVCVQ